MEALIENYMTPQVHSVRNTETLAEAKKLMKKYNIRHLPVLNDQSLVGLISDRDFALLALYPDMNLKESLCEDLMIQAVDTYSHKAKLADVVGQMAESKHGCAVIVDPNNHLLGVFTAIDALKLLHKIYDPN